MWSGAGWLGGVFELSVGGHLSFTGALCLGVHAGLICQGPCLAARRLPLDRVGCLTQCVMVKLTGCLMGFDLYKAGLQLRLELDWTFPPASVILLVAMAMAGSTVPDD